MLTKFGYKITDINTSGEMQAKQCLKKKNNNQHPY